MKSVEANVTAVEAPAIGAVAEPQTYTLLQDLAMLTKVRLTMLVLMTTAIGFGFGTAHGLDWFLFFRVMFGTAFVAASASVLNQFIERNVDRLMGRTRNRPLPAGRMAPGTALGLGVLLGVSGLIYLVLRVSPLCACLAGATLAAYVGVYTPMKRKSAWCVTVGAIAGAVPPVIGWAAATGSLGTGAAILFGVLFFWQMPHFLSLAWRYRDEYAEAGFHMLRLSDHTGIRTAIESLGCACALTVVTLLPAFLGMAHPIYIAVALACDAWLLACAGLFLADRSRATALRLFLASIFYLPLVMALLVACRR